MNTLKFLLDARNDCPYDWPEMDNAILELDKYITDMDEYLDYTTGGACSVSVGCDIEMAKKAHDSHVGRLIKEEQSCTSVK